MANQPHTEDAGTNRVGPAGGKPSFSQSADWGWMNKKLNDAGWRYYSAVRAYIFDSDEEFEVDITDEVVAELLEKSARTIARARENCYAAGMIEELAFWKESVRVEGKSKPEVRTFRRLIVHHEVPDGYEGPVNAYREKRRIEQRRSAQQREAREAREKARQESKAAPAPAAEPAPESAVTPELTPESGSDSTNLSGQSDQARSETGTVCDTTNLSWSVTNLSESVTNLSRITTSDQAKQVPYLPYHLPSHQPTNAAPEQTPAEQDSGNELGWMDDSQNNNTNQPAAESAGARLLRGLRAANKQGIAAHAVRTWTPFVEELLSKYSTTRVTSMLSDGAKKPGLIIHKLRELEAQHAAASSSSAEQSSSGKPEWCGDDDCDPVTRFRTYPIGAAGPCPCRYGQVSPPQRGTAPSAQNSETGTDELMASGAEVLAGLGLHRPA